MKTKLIDYVDNGPIFITGHVNPDGDALGSAFALKLFFELTVLRFQVHIFYILLYKPY